MLLTGAIILLSSSFGFAEDTPSPSSTDKIQSEKIKPAVTELKIASVKNPFIARLPKPTAVEPVEEEETPKPMTISLPNPGTIITPYVEIKPIQEIAKVEPVKPPKMNITGLVWNTDLPQAIVNDKVVSLGDTVDGAVITDIREGGIDVLYKGAKFTIVKTD